MDQIGDKDRIVLYDKTFEKFIGYDEILSSVRSLAERINSDYRGRDNVVFLGVLNGAFMFMGDLMKFIDLRCRVSFIKLSSYQGVQSGAVRENIMDDMNIRGADVIIVEDVVDSGKSMYYLANRLKDFSPRSIEIAAVFSKPEACRYDISIRYSAMALPTDFIIGYGLDYDGLGRNYSSIYRMVNEK